jgi:hypothetical protein
MSKCCALVPRSERPGARIPAMRRHFLAGGLRGGVPASELGLRGVSTDALRQLLRALHRGELDCPVSPAGLACHGLQDLSDPLLSTFRGLEAAGVRAVLVTVLAERMD